MSRLRPFSPYLALTLFALLAAGPDLARAQMTCSDDGPFHLFRAVELGALIQAGHFFPRWSSHMAQGYGYPFYNFYAPLSSYVVVALHFLGLEYPAALKLAFTLGLWLAGIAAFLFVRGLWGERAGVVAGVAYLFAPYLAYDVLFRANFAEAFAFVWPPLILWGIGRSAKERFAGRSGSFLFPSPFFLLPSSFFLLPSSFFLVSLFYAALILTHNIFALLASPLFAGYLLLTAWQQRSWRVLWHGALALAMGIALAAYFWLPAVAERNLVHSDRLLVPPIFTWYTNFISLGELLAVPRPADPLLINPSPARAIGLIPVLLCLPALFSFLTTKNNTKGAKNLPFDLWHLAFFLLALLGYSFLTLPTSTPIWGVIKPLELVQFPWRMLGPASLCAAVLVGAGVCTLERRLSRLASSFFLLPSSFFIVFLFAANLTWWYPRYCPSPTSASVADLVAYEQATATIGTTAKGEYLPRTADYAPADDSLAQALQRGEEPSRLLVAVGEAEVSSPAPRDPLDAAFTITARTDAAVVYRQFYYPGWRVTVDGQPVAIQVTPGDGLISFTLPPGSHTVHVYFGLTPLRAVAAAISLLTLVGLIAYGAWHIAYRPPSRSPAPPRSHPPTLPHTHTHAYPHTSIGLWDLGFFALLLTLKLAVIDRFPNPLRHSAFDGETVSIAQTPLRADFAGGVSLYGYDLSTRRLSADGALDAVLYLSVREPTAQRYWPAFAIEDAQGIVWSDPDYLPPRWHREPPHTPLWPPRGEAYAQWARRLSLLPGTPPGEYQLWGRVFDLDSLQIASVLDEQGNAIAPRLSLGTLTITRPPRPFPLQPEQAAPHTFGPLTLLGYHLNRADANAGDTLELTLYWKSEAAMTRDDAARLELLNEGGVAVYGVDLSPVTTYPTGQWQAGDQWRGQHRLTLPATLATGDYRLSLSVAEESGAQTLGSVHVTAPQRTFTRPAMEIESGAVFEGVGVLEGYTLERAGKTVTVTLIWRATASPALSYSAFVHLGSEGGRVWAQSDAVPAQWTRPTTGWVPGEYITDVHTFTLPDDLPAGTYTLFVGLYDPAAANRVPVSGPGAGGDNRVAIEEIAWP